MNRTAYRPPSEVTPEEKYQAAKDAVQDLPGRDPAVIRDVRRTVAGADSMLLRPEQGLAVRLEWIMPQAPCSQCYGGWRVQDRRSNDDLAADYTYGFDRPWPMRAYPTLIWYRSMWDHKGNPMPLPANMACTGQGCSHHAEDVFDTNEPMNEVPAGVWTMTLGTFGRHFDTWAYCEDCYCDTYEPNGGMFPHHITEKLVREGPPEWGQNYTVTPAWDMLKIKPATANLLQKFQMSLVADSIFPLWIGDGTVLHGSDYLEDPDYYEEGTPEWKEAVEAVDAEEKYLDDISRRADELEDKHEDPSEAVLDQAADRAGLDRTERKMLKELTGYLTERSMRGWQVFLNHQPSARELVPMPIRLLLDV